MHLEALVFRDGLILKGILQGICFWDVSELIWSKILATLMNMVTNHKVP
jgi:hypothetical protein